MNEKIDESWAEFWKNRVLTQYECPTANCFTPQDRRCWMLDSRDVVWYEGWPGLHELRPSGYRVLHFIVRLTTVQRIQDYVLNFIAIDLQLYKVVKIMRVSFFDTRMCELHVSFNKQMFADSKYTVDAAAFSGNRQNDIGFQKP